MQDSRSWILMPTKVDYYISSDNVNFTFVGSVTNEVDPKQTDTTIKNFEFKSAKVLKARYIKVKATNFENFPSGIKVFLPMAMLIFLWMKLRLNKIDTQISEIRLIFKISKICVPKNIIK